jgi:hypothetical protein
MIAGGDGGEVSLGVWDSDEGVLRQVLVSRAWASNGVEL